MKIRDAKIKLEQGMIDATDDNLGVVSLLYVSAEYRINPRWVWHADLDGLAGGPGRVIDFSTRLTYEPTERRRVGIGYRALEGGVDTDDVYNFAWFNTAFASVGYRL